MDNQEILNNEDSSPVMPDRGNNFIQFVGIFLRMAGFLIIGSVIALILACLLLGYNYSEVAQSGAIPQDKLFILTAQGLTQLFSFIILPLLYIYYFKKSLKPLLFQSSWNKFGIHALFAVLIMLFAIPLINALVDWNKSINLPDIFQSMEKWMQNKEEEAKKLTELIAYYNTPREFLIGFIVIAVLPAVGEELLFRGIIQNEFRQITNNPHMAIWMCGFLFSFMHLQFYGFFPRMLLGVTFGYLYYWSGNLIIPIIVHFLNNALTFILLNLYKHKMIDMDPESSDSFPAVSIIISFIVFLFLLFTFKKIGTKQEK